MAVVDKKQNRYKDVGVYSWRNPGILFSIQTTVTATAYSEDDEESREHDLPSLATFAETEHRITRRPSP